MSASNWAVCPKCADEAKRRIDENRAAVYATYGKVTPEEFDAARAALVDFDPEVYSTFREDYEFYGADEGVVTARYGGECQACGLSLDFKVEKPFYPDASSRPERGAS